MQAAPASHSTDTAPVGAAPDPANLGEAVLAWFQQGHTLAEAMDFGERELEVFYTAGFDLAGQGRLEDALRVFGLLASLDPYQGRFQHAMATCLQRLGRFEEAATSYVHLKLLEPDNPEVLFRLAECLLAMGEREAAAGLLDSLIEECVEECVEERSEEGSAEPRMPRGEATGEARGEAAGWAGRARALRSLLRQEAGAVPARAAPSTPDSSQGASA